MGSLADHELAALAAYPGGSIADRETAYWAGLLSGGSGQVWTRKVDGTFGWVDTGELAHAESKVAFTTATFGAYVDIPAMSLTVAAGVRPVMLEFTASDWTNNVAQLCYFAIKNVTLGQFLQTGKSDIVTVSKYVAVPVLKYRIPPNTSSYTYKVQFFQTISGGPNVSAAATGPMIFRAEEI